MTTIPRYFSHLITALWTCRLININDFLDNIKLLFSTYSTFYISWKSFLIRYVWSIFTFGETVWIQSRPPLFNQPSRNFTNGAGNSPDSLHREYRSNKPHRLFGRTDSRWLSFNVYPTSVPLSKQMLHKYDAMPPKRFIAVDRCDSFTYIRRDALARRSDVASRAHLANGTDQ